MVEILGKIFRSGDDVEPEKEIGCVKLESLMGFRYIYKVKKNMESIKDGDELVVNAKGPIHYNLDNLYSNSLYFDLILVPTRT